MEINFENALIEAHNDWQHSELEMLAWRTSLLGGKESSLFLSFFSGFIEYTIIIIIFLKLCLTL